MGQDYVRKRKREDGYIKVHQHVVFNSWNVHSDGLVVDGQNQVNHLTSWWYDDITIAMSLQRWYIYSRYPSCIAVFWPSQLVQEIIHQPYYLRLSNWIGLPFIQGLLDGSGVSQVDETTHLLEFGSDEFWETGLSAWDIEEWMDWSETYAKHRKRLNQDAAGLDWMHSSCFLSMIGTRMCIYIYIYTVYTYCIRLYIIYRVIIYLQYWDTVDIYRYHGMT